MTSALIDALLFTALSALLIGAYRYIAIRNGWLDTANARSSHSGTVPRGSGIVIVALILIAAALHTKSLPMFFLSLLPGLLIAAIGWWDDVRSLPAAPRFLAYWSGALLALLAIGDYSAITTTATLLWIAASLALLWSINLYNFMDGINGLAALEAVFVLTASLLLAGDSPYTLQLRGLSYCAIGALIGFLFWNFPLGKVFMGDVGSAFLGFFIPLLALWSSLLQGPGVAVWLILLGVFVADTSYTLIVRVATGQPWHQAHRTHAYQLLNQKLGSHPKTVAVLMGVNIAWLFPWAWALQAHWTSLITALSMAYVPLLVVCYALKAGIPATAGV